MSLSFNFCLGSEKISNWAKITLLPCNDHSPVQTWECKDESLFGLKGHPLHLNYGNKKDNVVLYTGTGDLSRWQIYETKRNLCSGYQVVPVPNITVFRQMEDRERVMVMCSFGKRLNESTFHLLLEGEHNYTQNNPLCYSSEKCVFEVKDSPPVSLICEHKIHSVESHQSETYIYSASGVAEEEGISLFYICFSSFIAVGLLIMIAAVVVTTIMSKTKRFNEYCDR
ncbi:hypothetical protein QQF64_032605 [Cirrhinus molitorella]|uniref:Uncharacterized protein n=1 Tax=Cirrhinus molitorella TaxID=172907 RepID=A0ABR3N0I5_9TELE